jgi:NADPH:quinone reductase-like Zn-dependent oxidoreductase
VVSLQDFIDCLLKNICMHTMALNGKAIIYEGLGGPEVIKVIEHNVRPPEAGEVRIKVKAAAVNPTDALLRKIENNMVKFPVIPGTDAAGVIESVGQGVSTLQVGDKVMAAVTPYRPDGGAQATFIIAPVTSVVKMPAGVTFAQAAGLPMNSLTSLGAIELTGLRAGQVLAISGGAGVLAHYTIASAKKQGLTVITDAKTEENALVRSYGADFVVERGDDFASAIRKQFPDGVDALIDTAVLGNKSFSAICDGGIYIHVRRTADVPNERRIQARLIWYPDLLRRTEWLNQLREMVENGEIQLKVAGEYLPEQVYEAQQTLAAGGLRGRAVIVF